MITVYVLSVYVKGAPDVLDIVAAFDTKDLAIADGEDRVARYAGMGYPYYGFEIEELTLQSE